MNNYRIALSVGIAIALSGCSSPSGGVTVFTDIRTDCQYLIVSKVRAVSITPRLRADGTQVCGNPSHE